MAKTTSLYLPKAANNQSLILTSADTTTKTLCFTAGADDSDVKAIIVASNDTAAINLALYVTRGGTDYLLGVVNVPVSSGTTGALPSIDLLNSVLLPGLPIDNVGKSYLPLKNGDTLKAAVLVTMTAAKSCYISVFGQDY
jgi:hypothetical protein